MEHGVGGKFARQAEISDDRARRILLVGREYHVGGFQVAVNDLGLMQRVEAVGDLTPQLQHFLARKGFIGLQAFGQSRPIEQLHGKKDAVRIGAAVRTEVMDAAHVAVTDAPRQLHLAL